MAIWLVLWHLKNNVIHILSTFYNMVPGNLTTVTNTAVFLFCMEIHESHKVILNDF